MKVAVIGAGISGLSAGFFLKKNGADVTIYEKNDYPGGTIYSKYINGFLVESGPNSTSETNAVIDEVVTELGIKGELVYANDNSKHRFIVRNGRLNVLPENPISFIATPLW
ncbi:MAG: protoporphyrinogen/coproporphyrinogen oxidase, partial [Candidatus Kryptoniota bacterium]